MSAITAPINRSRTDIFAIYSKVISVIDFSMTVYSIYVIYRTDVQYITLVINYYIF